MIPRTHRFINSPYFLNRIRDNLKDLVIVESGRKDIGVIILDKYGSEICRRCSIKPDLSRGGMLILKRGSNWDGDVNHTGITDPGGFDRLKTAYDMTGGKRNPIYNVIELPVELVLEEEKREEE